MKKTTDIEYYKMMLNAALDVKKEHPEFNKLNNPLIEHFKRKISLGKFKQ